MNTFKLLKMFVHFFSYFSACLSLIFSSSLPSEGVLVPSRSRLPRESVRRVRLPVRGLVQRRRQLQPRADRLSEATSEGPQLAGLRAAEPHFDGWEVRVLACLNEEEQLSHVRVGGGGAFGSNFVSRGSRTSWHKSWASLREHLLPRASPVGSLAKSRVGKTTQDCSCGRRFWPAGTFWLFCDHGLVSWRRCDFSIFRELLSQLKSWLCSWCRLLGLT